MLGSHRLGGLNIYRTQFNPVGLNAVLRDLGAPDWPSTWGSLYSVAPVEASARSGLIRRLKSLPGHLLILPALGAPLGKGGDVIPALTTTPRFTPNMFGMFRISGQKEDIKLNTVRYYNLC